ncbi:beta-galactosidase family protein [Streptomyces sp. NPDC058417]|uniref:glycoside hydrolase family 35 protein n=1 Tax=unclassified Streptomyces TaxID=2593676 RepID=UPI00365ADDFB
MLTLTPTGFRLHHHPFRIISGSLHYFRLHPAHWQDRLHKARLMGLNTVDVYVPWNLHQPTPHPQLDLTGTLDLPRFLDLAAAEGLHVLLRPGPYICAEWEAGGLPSWLLTDPDIRLRTTDPRYLAPVERYFDLLLPVLRPHLATAGGPVIAVQVENEYGAAASHDPAYPAHLADLLRRHGVDVPLFTSDQAADLDRGTVPGVLPTVNLWGDVGGSLAALRRVHPEGPLMCGEFWAGWFDRWGAAHQTRGTEETADLLDGLLAAGASVNLYMFHGGTNFGFTNGANDKGRYRPTVTSYDYDAPLDEAGDPTAKYHRFREVIGAHAPLPPDPVPAPAPKLAVDAISVPLRASLLAQADRLGTPVASEHPLTMEELGQSFGFVRYETTLPSAGPGTLVVPGVRDRAQVLVDGQPVGVLEREHKDQALSLSSPAPGARLTLLVENQGRVNYGAGLHDRKGLLGDVTFDGTVLTGWRCTPLPLDSPRALDALTFTQDPPAPGPAFHRGTFEVGDPADTYLHLDGWTKGNAWINGFALGRYWSRGPQRSLYVPGPVLRPGRNDLVVLELHGTATATAALRTTPDLGPTDE